MLPTKQRTPVPLEERLRTLNDGLPRSNWLWRHGFWPGVVLAVCGFLGLLSGQAVVLPFLLLLGGVILAQYTRTRPPVSDAWKREAGEVLWQIEQALPVSALPASVALLEALWDRRGRMEDALCAGLRDALTHLLPFLTGEQLMRLTGAERAFLEWTLWHRTQIGGAAVADAPWATAILMALETLREPCATEVAQRLVARDPSPAVREAAADYLRALP